MKKTIFVILFGLFASFSLLAQKTDGYTQVADKWPMFPGCEQMDASETEIRKCADQKLYDYIFANLRYPKQAKADGVEGTVVVKFMIDAEGNLSNPSIARDIGSGCGEAALEVVENMIGENIKFLPAEFKGKGVEMEFALPFKFSLGN